MIKSVYTDQKDILKAIIDLHCPDGFECDVTYGNGMFYTEIPKPKYVFDIDPQFDFVEKASSTDIPLPDNSLKSIMFDPPFLTYIKRGRDHGNGKMIMSSRFGGYWSYQELEDHYRGTIKEAYRLLDKKGILVVKCQDIIHNHKLHATHVNVINWAEEYGFRLKDLFVLTATNRIGIGKGKTQKHARIFHSYFLVFISLKK